MKTNCHQSKNDFNQTISKNVSLRRTFAIISHPDAGKTTLTEKLLLFSGAIQLAGTVKAKKSGRYALSDWMEIEKQRGISVASSVMQFKYHEHTINLLDTPGHQDFSEDTYRVLTAVDSALMVIDAAKGVETQTIKLLNVCRLRNTPIITFINKMDRETRDPIELIDELESVLKIDCAPITWPIGMGKSFKGVYHIDNDEVFIFTPGTNKISHDFKIINGLNNFKEKFSEEFEQLFFEIDLIKNASNKFSLEKFLSGKLMPVFFGSAINNFGVREVLDALVNWAQSPTQRNADQRVISPNEKKFSGFVFKIQANMDPSHHDRMAFVRVCSGKFKKGMKLHHVRLKRDIKISSVINFMACEREQIEEAYAGDIIGLPNHGNIQIGDSFSEGEFIQFNGIPFFAPDLFRSILIKNPLRTKQLLKGLQQLGEEGAVQVFKMIIGSNLILGAIGVLQFEVVISRLKNEYGVEAEYNNVNFNCARWISTDNKKILEDFENSNAKNNLAFDADGNLTYLATSAVNLKLIEEKWDKLKFHSTREYNKNF